MPQGNEARMAELAEVQANVRSLLHGIGSPSSLYSHSPNPGAHSTERFNAAAATPALGPTSAPNANSRGLMGRRWPASERPMNQSMSDLPLRSDPDPINYSPATQPSEWGRQPVDEEAPPLPRNPQRIGTQSNPNVRTSDDDAAGDADVEAATPSRGRRTKKRKWRHHEHGAWIRRHGKHRRLPLRKLMQAPARTKFFSCIVAGLFLACLLAVYLTVALTVRSIGQELHIIFILAILATTSFFCHILVSLHAIVTRPPPRRRRHPVPNLSGPTGFRPDVPIRVHLARDDDIVALAEDGSVEPEKLPLKAPPPAYGLWRCSVRVDPNLLHWRRVDNAGEGSGIPKGELDEQAESEHVEPQQPSERSEAQHQTVQPRPPSYVSDDGVTYVVAAEPRTTIYLQRPPSELHPAFRNQSAIVPIERCA